MMSRRHAALSLAAALACCATARADITYTDLFTLGKPAGYSYAGPWYGPDSVHVIANGQVSGYGTETGVRNHALLWTKANPNGVDFTPSADQSDYELLGTNGTQQFGINSLGQALVWTGTPSSAILLPRSSPSLFQSWDEPLDMHGGQVVGKSFMQSSDTNHATLWTSVTAAPIDLNPAGYISSIAVGTDGSHQTGSTNVPAGSVHAALWSGSSDSFKDLNPMGYSDSEAVAVNNGEEVGVASIIFGQNHGHAMLWKGSADSFVDLNPDGFVASSADDTDGIRQVGSGSTVEPVDPRVGITPSVALLWNGSPDDYINLGALLPSNFVASTAISIEGDQVYGLGIDTDGNFHAI
ncbi:MAG: hypothetical protein ACTHLZ_11990, partial [Tepidisphaeraceae bacterium]